MSLTAVDTYPTQDDWEHERRLHDVMDAIRQATDEHELNRLWLKFNELHAQRSKRMVAHLERVKGLI